MDNFLIDAEKRTTVKEKVMALNKAQKFVAKRYDGGAMKHVKSIEEADNCGDAIFALIMRKAQDAKSDRELRLAVSGAMSNMYDLLREIPLTEAEEAELAACRFDVEGVMREASSPSMG